MLPYDSLKTLAGYQQLYPLFASTLSGATTEIAAPGGTITHAILNSANFPHVIIAIEGNRSRTRTCNFFTLPPDLYQDSEWCLADPSGEAKLTEGDGWCVEIDCVLFGFPLFSNQAKTNSSFKPPPMIGFIP